MERKGSKVFICFRKMFLMDLITRSLTLLKWNVVKLIKSLGKAACLTSPLEFFADVRDHAIPLFLEAIIFPITFLFNLMYDINTDNASINMLPLMKKTPSIDSYNTDHHPPPGTFMCKAVDWRCKSVLSLDLD